MKLFLYRIVDLVNSIIFNLRYLPLKQAVRLPIKTCGLIGYDYRGVKNR